MLISYRPVTDGRTSNGILGSLARAEQLRRRRFVTRHLLRVLPATAGVLLVTAAIVRLVHAPIAIFWAAFALAIVGVAAFAWIAGRVPPITDARALQLDTDAGLAGELRSAHWFSSNPVSNAWTAFHLDRATGTIDSVSWAAVYPPVKAARAWAGSALLALAAIAVVLTTAWPLAKGKTPIVDAKKAAAVEVDAGIPTDLQRQIDELIKAVQSGEMPMDEARAKVSELRDKLAGLDPKTQAALAKAAADQKPPSKEELDAKSLADRAKEAAAKPFLPQDMKWSMEDLASKLKYAGKPKEKSSEEDQQGEETSKAAGQKGDADSQKAGESSAQMTRSTSADAQSSQMMAATMSPMGGERGPNADPKKANVGQALDLKGNLRKEEIDADSDSEGANVLNEMRKKSEKSNSALGFSRVAPLAAYDKSRAVPPPPPSDAVRALLKNYFIRK